MPGPIKLKTKAGDVYRIAMATQEPARKAIGLVSAAALAGSEENARGHLVITAPTGGSAGVMPAIIYSLGPEGAKHVRRRSCAKLFWPRQSLVTCASTTRLCRRPKAAARPRSAWHPPWELRQLPKPMTRPRLSRQTAQGRRSSTILG